MLQRIQTIYYAISFMCLMIVSLGSNVYSFLTHEKRYDLSAYGIQESTLEGMKLGTTQIPFYLTTLMLALFTLLVIFSYKKTKRQFRLGRLLLFFYLLFLILVVSAAFWAGGMITGLAATTRELGLGFFLLVMGFPFVFLGNIGVKRDKNLLDSLNRLR